MLLPITNAEGNPLKNSLKNSLRNSLKNSLRNPLAILAAITAITCLTLALPTFADDDSEEDPDATEQHEGHQESNQENNQENTERYGIRVFDGGVTEMMPTEYYQYSVKYGRAIYRRYIEQSRDRHTNQVLSEAGKIIQEYYVSHDMLEAEAESLADTASPAGLQYLGIVAVKLWLKKAHSGVDERNACLYKPEPSMQPERLLPEGEAPQITRQWVHQPTEADEDLEKCGLSLRLETDFRSADELFMNGYLCRYPYGRSNYSATHDDAECVFIHEISLEPEDILLLSEDHERIRLEASVTRAEKELSSEKNYLNRGAIEPESVGVISEMFGQFLPYLDVIKYGTSPLNPSYVRKVSKARYEEKVVRQDYTRSSLKDFINNLGGGLTYAQARKQGEVVDLKDAGVDLSVGEFYHKLSSDPSKPTFTMKIEKDKAITFEDKVHGEIIVLENKTHMDYVAQEMWQVSKLRQKSEECTRNLGTCKAAKTLLEKEAERLPELVAEKAALEQRLLDKEENHQKEYSRLQDLIQKTGDTSIRAAKQDQKEIDNAILEQEKTRHQEALSKAESQFASEKRALTDKHDVTVAGLRDEISQLKATIRDKEAQGTSSRSEIERLNNQVKTLQEQVDQEYDRYEEMLSNKERGYKATIDKLEDEVEALLTYKKDATKLAREHDAESGFQLSKLKSVYDARIEELQRRIQLLDAYAHQGPFGNYPDPGSTLPHPLKIKTITHKNGTTVVYDETDYSRPSKDEL